MQKILLLLLLLISCSCFGQRKGNVLTVGASNYKVKGICNGVRLDTLSCRFINVYLTAFGHISTYDYFVDCGQGTTKETFNDLKDEANHYIEFTSLTVLLNFMDYNGWLYQNTIVSQRFENSYSGKPDLKEAHTLIFYKENK